MKFIRKITLVLFFCSLYVVAQELPPVVAYPPSEYNSDNQNWSISQDNHDIIYVGNNKGLLVFNGEKWELYNSPNESIIRSVFADEERIYTGCFREFGYWTKDEYGKLNYTSLTHQVEGLIESNEEFWTILKQENWVIFQSLHNLYLYHTQTEEVKKIEVKDEINKAILLANDIYISQPNKGIYKIKNAKLELVSDAQIFKDNLVIALYKDGENILVQTERMGIYHLSEKPTYWNKDTEKELLDYTVYSAKQTEDGNIVLGTISQGMLLVSIENASITYHITKEQSLSNNTVLSIFEDSRNNLWLGLDHGIDCLNLNSPIRIYQDKSGLLGTVYASIVYDDFLYLGTNQGLFVKPVASEQADFEFINGSAGQVWSLYQFNNQLLCGHNNGLFEIENNNLTQISQQPTWVVREVPNHPTKLLLGNYNGLSMLSYENQKWTTDLSVEGFDLSARYVEFINENAVVVSHEYQGVYKVQLDDKLTKAVSVEKLNSVDRGLFSSLSKLDNTIFYSYEKGVFRYKDEIRQFIKDDTLSLPYLENGYSSGRIIVHPDKQSLWTFSDQSIHQFTPNDIDGHLTRFDIPINVAKRNAMLGYESVFYVGNETYLLGNSQGYFVIDMNNVKGQKIEFQLAMKEIINWGISDQKKRVSLEEKSVFSRNNNNITFQYYVPNYGYFLDTNYQYRLKGLLDEWSEWSTTPEVSFYNLGFGDYTLEVRASIGGKLSAGTLTYSFVVERPFYLSNIMIFVYLLIFIIIALLVHTSYNKHYKKQKKKIKEENKKEMEMRELENQRQLMRIKNEQLQADIDAKNRELAISTMSMIKKNEFMNSIKDELNKIKESSTGIKRVLRIIDKNLNNTDDWKFFEEAFNNADKDFLKKIKEKHPSLTPNDLRLCAYLRLNLSSKEIAPLFNISLKSVEVKRYRLRKKMNLNRDESLTNYILEL